MLFYAICSRCLEISFVSIYVCSSLSADRDLKLHLPNSQSENAIKQLKTLTSPLTKFAANIGSALDPRKYGSKVIHCYQYNKLLNVNSEYCTSIKKIIFITDGYK